MEKRFIAFIVLSFLIMAGWQLVVGRLYPQKPRTTEVAKEVPQQPSAISTDQANNQSSATTTPQDLPPTPPETGIAPSNISPRKVTVVTPLWRAIFDNQGGVIKSLNIERLPNGREVLSGEYKQLELISSEGFEKVGAPFRLEVDQNPDLTKKLNNSYYSVETPEDTIQVGKGEQKDLVFSFQDESGLLVKKRFRFYGNQFLFDLGVDATLNGQPLQANMFIGPNFGDQSVKQVDTYVNTPQQIIVETGNGKSNFLTGKDLEHRNAPPDAQRVFNDNVNWFAAADHYFAMAVISPANFAQATVEDNFYTHKVDNEDKYKHLLSVKFPVVSGQTFQVYAGPKDRNILFDANKTLNGRVDLEDMINYGIFSFMVKPLMPVLEIGLAIFYKLTHNYGWAIIGLTFIINMLFFPLKWKSSIAMKKAMKMQPKMKEIQEKIKGMKKDDPRMQQLQLDQMKLMKEGNPVAGCLPLLLQMPIFWAFFIFLSISIDVRHSPFIFWVKDLAAADPTMILPIVMTISMVASSWLTPTPNDPAQRMQKIMTSFVMPIVFLLLFFKNAPSGLVLYWMFGNIIGVGQQLLINKMTSEPPAPDTPTDPKKTKDDKKLSDKDKNRTQTGDLANVR
jgi:YidC/Oxa1 family membrane protein insertase